MKFRNIVTGVCVAMAFIACDDNTGNIGLNITDGSDILSVSTDSFVVHSQSVAAAPGIARNANGYLGQFTDPETNTPITANFMTQFATLENFSMPTADKIVSKVGGMVVADSCELLLFYENGVGDSLAPLRISMFEMSQPLHENQTYTTAFNPVTAGVVNTSVPMTTKTFTLEDQSVSATERAKKDYSPSIRFQLSQPYQDATGTTYNNYGTYLMRQYYQHPEYFRNTYYFVNHVVPGFYFQITNGTGAIAKIYNAVLQVYYRYNVDGVVHTGVAKFGGTQEVKQVTQIINQPAALTSLLNDNTGTYLKTPSGILTELTLPINDIMLGHENDSINAAKITLQRINNTSVNGYALQAPQQVLMVESDSLQSFFSHHQVTDYKNSFTTTLSNNGYTFSNIGSLVRSMYTKRKNGSTSPNWNKVVIIPVTTTTMNVQDNGYNNMVITGVYNDLNIRSTKLVGGNTPLRITVIYSRFK